MVFDEAGEHLTLGCIQSRCKWDDELEFLAGAGGAGAAKRQNPGGGEHLREIVADLLRPASGK